MMPIIRPVSDLRNKFAEISKVVRETGEPIYLTKNGHGDMVVMSIEAYERILFQTEVHRKLKEAEAEAKDTEKRYTPKEVITDLRAGMDSKQD